MGGRRQRGLLLESITALPQRQGVCLLQIKCNMAFLYSLRRHSLLGPCKRVPLPRETGTTCEVLNTLAWKVSQAQLETSYWNPDENPSTQTPEQVGRRGQRELLLESIIAQGGITHRPPSQDHRRVLGKDLL